MKKLLLLISGLAALYTLHAQVLYGTASDGGINGKGTIAKFDLSAGTLTAAFTFETPDGAHPQFSSLIQAANGKLYGMTRFGGINNDGAIFSYDPATASYIRLKDFDGTTGIYPYGSLMQATDGKLYGMTTYGGNNNAGVVFSFDPATTTYTKLRDFDRTGGAYPYGSLMQAADGKLYGMTSFGGTRNTGVIFSVDPATSAFTKLKDFDGGTGGSPYGSLIQAADGKLYGLTTYGGSKGEGVIFSFVPGTATYTRLLNFDAPIGSNPYGSLVQASDGKLYGTASRGGSRNNGVIFSFNPATATYIRLKDFDAAIGSTPYGNLTQATDGKLYGTTSAGGSNFTGVIFSFNPTTAVYTKLKDLNNAQGSNPQGNLVQAANGMLYSMTTNGGSGDNGVIFSFNPAGAAYTKLKDFGANTTGSNIIAGVFQNGAGKLYGMTNTGGSNGGGIIYSFNSATSVYTHLYDFDGTNGSNPKGSLMRAADGKLYGMTYNGGTNGYGVLFSFDTATSQYTNLYNFDYNNGANPSGNLIQAANGILYGTTYYGGSNGYGVIFSFDPANSTFTKLLDLDYLTGAYPSGSLTQATDGKLYGLTMYGGIEGFGVVFSFDPVTAAYTDLQELIDTTGGNPSGNLVQATNGKLYGMTPYGGTNNAGTIFSYDIANVNYAKLVDFDVANGSTPYGSLTQVENGNLYGVTYSGGSYNKGVVFSFAPATIVYTKIQDFDNVNGSNPKYVSLASLSCIPVTYYRDADGDGFGNANNSMAACVQPVGYITNNTDCNDSNASEKPGQTWYIDADGDGYSGSSITQCLRPAHGFLLTELTGGTGDCNDADASVHPNATEIPGDGIDQDCDGFDAKTWYADSDGDGFGNPAVFIIANTQPTGYVANNTDCDDTKLLYKDNDEDGYGTGNAVACGVAANTDCNDADASIHPNATEITDDGIDQNCDGADLKTWYADADNDGFGNAGVTTTANTQPAGYVANNTDCNDGDATVHTPQQYYVDADHDGYGSGITAMVCASTPPYGYSLNNTDCNDADNTVYPGAPELCDGKDNNCNGTVDEGCVALPTIRINNVTQAEGNSGTKPMVFTITLSKKINKTVMVNYTTLDNTAKAPLDYVAASGTVTFAAGEKTKTLSVLINGDVTVEKNEKFQVNLSSPVNAAFTDSVGVGTIQNDDAASSHIITKQNSSSIAPAVSVSPNPANSIINVRLTGFTGKVTLQLMTSAGKLIKENTLQTSNVKYAQQAFSVAGIASGTYFVVVFDEAGNKQTKKAVVAH